MNCETLECMDYVTSKIAAARLGVGLSTLQSWAARGVITPAWRTPGGQARWDIADLARQLGIPEPSSEPQPDGPPVAVAIVTSPLGVLAGRRNDGAPPWTFIAGRMQTGEEPTDTAVREVKEETGLEVRAGRELGRRIHPATGRELIYLTASPATDDLTVFVGDAAELAEVRWLTLADTGELMPDMYPRVRRYLLRVLKNI